MSQSAFVLTFADTYEGVSREHIVAVFLDEAEAERFCAAAQKEADRVIDLRQNRYENWKQGDPSPSFAQPRFDIGIWENLTERIYYQIEKVELNPALP